MQCLHLWLYFQDWYVRAHIYVVPIFCSVLSSLQFESVVADVQVTCNTWKKSFSEVSLSQITFVTFLL